MPSTVEIVAARLARMKGLIADLESACAASSENRDKFVKLNAELEAARAALNTSPPPTILPSSRSS